jgi:type II secretory pathway component PulJ
LEVTIAASLVFVVIAAVLSVLDSFTRADARLDDRSEATQSREVALGELARDLRAAERIDAPHAASEMHSRLTAQVVGATGTRVVHWDLTDTGTLERTLGDAPPGATDLRRVASDLDSEESGFRYFDSEGRELVPGRLTAEEVVRCTARVELRLVSADHGGAGLGESSTTVSMRNRGVVAGC